MAETAPGEWKPLSQGTIKEENQTLSSGPRNVGLEVSEETKWVRGQTGKRGKKDGGSPEQRESPNRSCHVRMPAAQSAGLTTRVQSFSSSHWCLDIPDSFTDTSWFSPSYSFPFLIPSLFPFLKMLSIKSRVTWGFPGGSMVKNQPSNGVDVGLISGHFGDLMQRTNSLEKTLMLGKTEHRGRRG